MIKPIEEEKSYRVLFESVNPFSGRKSWIPCPCGDWAFADKEAKSFAWGLLAAGHTVKVEEVER